VEIRDGQCSTRKADTKTRGKKREKGPDCREIATELAGTNLRKETSEVKRGKSINLPVANYRSIHPKHEPREG